MKYISYIILTLFVVLIRCAPEGMTLVTVDNTKYSITDFKEFHTFTPAEDSAKRMELIDEFINRMLVVREAKELGYKEDPVVVAAFETHSKDIIMRNYYEAEVVNKIKIPESEMRKVYDKIVDQYHLAQIVVDDESLALYINDELKKGTLFNSLVEFSLDTLSEDGDIGSFSVMSLPPEVLEAVEKTKIGETTDLIAFGGYFYFLKVIEHKKVDTQAYNEVKENIRNNLMREKVTERGEEFTLEIIDKAKIEYNQAGLDVLIKPDSLITEQDLNTWVVKKYDTSYVYVKTIINAVKYQYERSSINPQYLIERVLIPDLVYDAAIRARFDEKAETKKKLENTMATILYQKFYSDMVLEKAIVDSAEVISFYKEHKDEYKDKTLSEVYSLLKVKVRDEKIAFIRKNLFEELRKKYAPKINETAVTKLLKEEM